MNKFGFESLEDRRVMTGFLASYAGGDVFLTCQAETCETSGAKVSSHEPGLKAAKHGFQFTLQDEPHSVVAGSLVDRVFAMGESAHLAKYGGGDPLSTLSVSVGVEGLETDVVLINNRTTADELKLKFVDDNVYLECVGQYGCDVRGIDIQSTSGRLDLFNGLGFEVELEDTNRQYSAGNLTKNIHMDAGETSRVGIYTGWFGDLAWTFGNAHGELIEGTLHPYSPNAPRPRFGDFDLSGEVDFQDFLIMADQFGERAPDGYDIGFQYFLWFQLQYGEAEPQPLPFD